MQGNGMSREPPADLPDRALWQHSRMTDSSEDEAGEFLDLAGFAEGRLDADDSDRVAERLIRDPAAAADVAAAAAPGPIEAAPDAVIARACALVDGTGAEAGAIVVPFRPRSWAKPAPQHMARWGSLAAAVAVAAWVGFTLGADASRAFVPAGQPGGTSYLNELLDPPSGFVRELTEGAQT